jgi:putative nucleotidyltransferase with HDIG domain
MLNYIRESISIFILQIRGYERLTAILRVVLPYLVFAVVWIILSDRAVLVLSGNDVFLATQLQSIKGLAFVLSSSILIGTSLWVVFGQKSSADKKHQAEVLAYVNQLEQSRRELEDAYEGVIQAWAQALEMRDLETGGHSKRVAAMMDYMAKQFNFNLEQRKLIRWGALLHDIGKMGIPDSILLKTGPLTVEERDIMEKHPDLATHFLENVPLLIEDLSIPLRHHERWDGSGYPGGLNGHNIPLTARIFAVVDTADAMSIDRPYRPAIPVSQIYTYLKSEGGRLYDPQVVSVFIEHDVLRKVE